MPVPVDVPVPVTTSIWMQPKTRFALLRAHQLGIAWRCWIVLYRTMYARSSRLVGGNGVVVMYTNSPSQESNQHEYRSDITGN